MKDIAELQREEEQREEQKRQEEERERLEEERERQEIKQEQERQREEKAPKIEEEAQQIEEIQQKQDKEQSKVHLEKLTDQPQKEELEKNLEEQPKTQPVQQLAPQKNNNNASKNNTSKNDSKIIIFFMVVVVAVIIIGSVIVFSFSRKNAEENSNYTAFEVRKDDFTIDLPKDWDYEVLEPDSGQEGYSVACINEEFESTILILATPKDEELTADDLVDAIGLIYSSFGFNPITRDYVTINKADGVKYEAIIGNPEIGEFYQMGFITLGDDYNFSIIIQSSVDVMDEMRPTFDHVINSFKLK